MEYKRIKELVNELDKHELWETCGMLIETIESLQKMHNKEKHIIRLMEEVISEMDDVKRIETDFARGEVVAQNVYKLMADKFGFNLEGY